MANNIKINNNYINIWLFICCIMIFTMIIIGGLTRLTESGLSIVEWRLYGYLPPLNDADWIELFNKYKKFPEFKLLNKNININDFKFIFWMEYIHRIWGRLIFLVFLIPLIFFLKKKIIPNYLKNHFFIILLLIIIQGIIGWYMVKSGLVNEPNVSHYRLSIHLVMAFIIYGYILYLALTINNKKKTINKKNFLQSLNIFLIFLILITVFSGGMVAGLDAGLVYNTFPLMGDTFIPNDLLQLDPKFKNFFENPSTVQFDHRFLGITTFSTILIMWIYTHTQKMESDIKKKINLLLFVSFSQIGLGIATLLSFVSIPIAIMHQSGAVILYSMSIWILKSLPFMSK